MLKWHYLETLVSEPREALAGAAGVGIELEQIGHHHQK